MNHRRTGFVREYITTGNATEAAIKAGYSKATAYSQGQRLLKNVEIMNQIKESQERLQEESEVKLKEVVLEIKKIAFHDSNQALRLKALDMLMKHLGGYVDSLKLLSIMDEGQLEDLAKRLVSSFN